MPYPTITQTTYSAPHTSTGCADALSTAMTNAGLGTLYDSFVDSEPQQHRHRVHEVTINPSAAIPKIYLDASVSHIASTYVPGTIFQSMYTSWNTSTKTGVNGVFMGYTFYTSLSFTSNVPIVFTSINHPELKIVAIQQGSYHNSFGLLRPANKPSWWNENTNPYVFLNGISANNGTKYNPGFLLNFSGFPGSANPWNLGANNLLILTTSALQSANVGNNLKRDVLPGIIYLTNDSIAQGLVGKTSNDIVQVAATGLSFLDVLQVVPGTEEYTLITPGSSKGGNFSFFADLFPGVAIRTV